MELQVHEVVKRSLLENVTSEQFSSNELTIAMPGVMAFGEEEQSIQSPRGESMLHLFRK